MNKYLIILLLSGCASIPQSDIPEEIVLFSQTNVWKAISTSGTGTDFWVNDKVITACHVIGSSKSIYITNDTRDYILKAEVISCDTELDIAILVPEESDFKPLPTEIYTKPLKMGKTLYGAGFPYGSRLRISVGHYQGHSAVFDHNGIDRLTSSTIPGDSGGPALALIKNKVYVVGIRLMIMRSESLGLYRDAEGLNKAMGT